MCLTPENKPKRKSKVNSVKLPKFKSYKDVKKFVENNQIDMFSEKPKRKK